MLMTAPLRIMNINDSDKRLLLVNDCQITEK